MSGYISIRDMNISHGEHRILHDVNIEIPERKITVIIGPSGCGKTTLLKSINRMLEDGDGFRVSGSVLVRGADIYSQGTDVIGTRKRMGLLFQRPQVLPMSIFDNVAYGLRIHGMKDKKRLNEEVRKYLEMAQIWPEVKDRLHGPASRLSIGQQQRLCLARGLAVEPEIILGDEPTSSLDPLSAEGIEQLFIKLKDRYTVVLVTHILRQAKRLADHVIFLYMGRAVEQGPAQDFFSSPRNPKTRAYIEGRFIEDCEK